MEFEISRPGAKKGNDLFLVAGNGNSELVRFTEWKFSEEIQKSDSVLEKNITTIIYESQFDDRIPMPRGVILFLVEIVRKKGEVPL